MPNPLAIGVRGRNLPASKAVGAPARCHGPIRKLLKLWRNNAMASSIAQRGMGEEVHEMFEASSARAAR
jgi:hypothetical protein